MLPLEKTLERHVPGRVECRHAETGDRGIVLVLTDAQRAVGGAQEAARELGINGYARNLPDGRVVVLACGDEASVSTFVEWLWTGSSASKVTSVEVSDAALEAANVRPGFRTA